MLSPFLVQTGPFAVWLSRRKPVHVMIFVYRALDAIDPTETESFFYRIIVRNVRFSRVLLQENEPYFDLFGMVFFQPITPLLPVSRFVSHSDASELSPGNTRQSGLSERPIRIINRPSEVYHPNVC